MDVCVVAQHTEFKYTVYHTHNASHLLTCITEVGGVVDLDSASLPVSTRRVRNDIL